MFEQQKVTVAKSAAALCLQTKPPTPFILWGPPGEGKSSFINKIGQILGFHVETIIAALHEPTDFSGMPVKDYSETLKMHYTEFVPPSWFVKALENPKVLFFFDEATQVPPQTQAALLRLVLERVLGSFKLPESVAFAFAANDTATGGIWELCPPLLNRLVHINYALDPETFAIGITTGNWGDEEAILVVKDEVYNERLQFWCGAVASYVMQFQSDFRMPMEQVERNRLKSWQTARTWEFLARLMAACDASNAPDAVRLTLARGTVGEVAIKFLKHVTEMRIPKPEDLLKNPNLLPKDLDSAIAAIFTIAPFLMHQAEKFKQVVDMGGEMLKQDAVSRAMAQLEEWWNLAAALTSAIKKKHGADFAVIYLRTLKNAAETYKGVFNREVLIDVIDKEGLGKFTLAGFNVE